MLELGVAMAAKVTGAGMGEVTIPSEDDVDEVEEGGQLHGYEGEDKVEKQMLADHRQQQETIWQKHSQRLTDIVKNNEGVWISTKLFYVVGSLSLLSIITIVIEIAFYVYFHWVI